MSAKDPWAVVGSVDPADLVAPTLELHWAAQLVAAAGQAFAERREDDSHRAMTWDARRRRLVGMPFAGPYPFRVALRPQDLTLLMLDRTDETLGALPLSGVTTGHALEWLAAGMATYTGILPEPLSLPDYDMPAHRIGEGEPFGPAGRELGVVGALYGAAAGLLTELASVRSIASPVTCWPHHFDIATLLTLETDGSGTATKTVGVGLAPMGGGYDTWYWYVTPWPYPDRSSLPELGGPGAWHTEGWTGAVLTGSELVAAPDAFRDAVVRKFLDVSVEAAISALQG
jgi:hypothetical protein